MSVEINRKAEIESREHVDGDVLSWQLIGVLLQVLAC